MKSIVLVACILMGFSSCSPLRTAPHDDGYRWELTLHEVQTNVDDLRHDTNCFQAEIQILDGRMRSLENALALVKQQDIEKQQSRLDQFFLQLQSLEKKWTAFEKKQEGDKDSFQNLSQHAKETGLALTQFKARFEEMEGELIAHSKRLDALSKLKGNIEALAKALKTENGKTYKVRPGDTLEKIAKTHKIDVPTLKQLNGLQNDLIVVDQELQIP